MLAHIPFDVHCRQDELRAGKYTFTVVNPASDRKIVQVRSTEGRASAMIQTNDVNGIIAENAKLVFERYDDRYFFTQVQMGGEATRQTAIWSKSERKQTMATAREKIVIVISVG